MNDTTAPIDPRKRPKQARAQALVDAIMEGAARILETEGLDAATTNAIAEKAGVSIGSLYQYYPSREAILAELIRRDRALLRAAIADAVADGRTQGFEPTLDLLLAAAVQHQLARPRLARILEHAEDQLPLDEETEALNTVIVEEVSGFLEAHQIRDPKVAARDLVALVKGMVDAAGLAGETDAPALAERVSRAVRGYLAG